jgi:hypothetical protein
LLLLLFIGTANFGAVPLAQTEVREETDNVWRTASREQILEATVVRIVLHDIVSKASTSIKTQLGERVSSLKQQAAEFFQIPVANQQLIFGAKKLTNDNDSLRQAGLFMGCTVHVLTNQHGEVWQQA